MYGFGIHANIGPAGRQGLGRAANAADNTRQRALAGGTWRRARTWEGPLVSETIDLHSGSTGEPEESPSLSRSAGETAGAASSAGTSPAQAGAVRSWPDADDGTGTATVKSGTARRSGSGLSAKVLPELQQLAQSLGLTGTARMRKGDLIAAIEQAQHGGAGASGGPGRSADAGRGAAASGARGGRARGAAGGDTAAVPVSGTAAQTPDLHSDTSGNSSQRGAPAGAGANRHIERDAMDTQTSTQPGIGTGNAGGVGESPQAASTGGIGGPGQDALPYGGAPAVNASAQATAANGTRDDAQHAAEGPRGERRRRSSSGGGSNGRGDNRRDDNGRGDNRRDDSRREDGRRDDARRDEQPRAASDGSAQGRESGSGGRDQQASRDAAE